MHTEPLCIYSLPLQHEIINYQEYEQRRRCHATKHQILVLLYASLDQPHRVIRQSQGVANVQDALVCALQRVALRPQIAQHILAGVQHLVDALMGTVHGRVMLQREINVDGRFGVRREAPVQQRLALVQLLLDALFLVLIVLQGGGQMSGIVLQLIDAHFGAGTLRDGHFQNQHVQPIAVTVLGCAINDSENEPYTLGRLFKISACFTHAFTAVILTDI